MAEKNTFGSSRKIFAHYFDRFPLSIDNKKWDRDYYETQYLSPNGEAKKWFKHGGFLRSRPIPVSIHAESEYVLQNLKTEVHSAIAVGIGGFTYDILSVKDAAPGGRFDRMSQAAMQVNPHFKLVLMPDMAALGKNLDNVYQIVSDLYAVPNVFRLEDGRIVLSPFISESVPASEWQKLLQRFEAANLKVAFVPTFLSMKPSYVEDFRSISYGMGTFGTPLPEQGDLISRSAKDMHKRGLIFMAGVSPQGYRPKNHLYWEAKGSTAYRASWEGAIEGGADWIQLTTWNDYSESTQVAPYTDLSGADNGTAYYFLTAYYSNWFLNNKKPVLSNEVAYYFHRKQFSSSQSLLIEQNTKNVSILAPNFDKIELLVLLKSPATLAVEVNGKRFTKSADAGMTSFFVPLGTGRPHFTVERSGRSVIDFDSSAEVLADNAVKETVGDLTYWAGSASASGMCSVREDGTR